MMRQLSKRLRLRFSAVGPACALACLCSLAGCRQDSQPSTEARAFWSRFFETNRAWLDPQPGPLTSEFALQQKEFSASSQSYQWEDKGELRTWSTPDKNLRIIHSHRFDTHSPFRTNEHRYVRGKGGEVRLKPSPGGSRPLGLELWLAGRTGAGFLNVLHLCAAWGLPQDTVVKDAGGPTISLLLTNRTTRSLRWRQELTLLPSYGWHPAIFGSTTVVAPDWAEVTIDRATLRPLNITEVDRDGRLGAKITFDADWLELSGRQVPARIRCDLPTSKFVVQYEFTVKQGVWMLKTAAREHAETPSLSSKTTLRRLQPGAIPEDMFPRPDDLDLPPHSFTQCGPREHLLSVRTQDGLQLEGKLTLPPQTNAPAPVVMFLPGAGPWTFDRPLVFPDLEKLNEMLHRNKVYNYCDFFARELSVRGIAFFRMNKRGCGIVRDDEGYPQEICNRRLFSTATPSVLLRDYQAALECLRQAPGVDPHRIVLLGGSEGTRLAPKLALASPAGIRAVVMLGYAGDNTHDTIVWQHTVGPWRNVARLFDEDNDARITRKEYAAVIDRVGKFLEQALPFEQLDRNRDGTVVPGEMNNAAGLKRILKAFEERDDDYLWDNLVQLSADYLMEDWHSPPLHQTLLQLKLPLAIFHGENDGSCRVECAREAQRAFAKAGRTNLTLRTYPKADHDLNWARFLKDAQTPPAFRDIFDYIEAQLR